MKVDFFARRLHFIDHLAPIWLALDPEVRGPFYVSQYLKGYAEGLGLAVTPMGPTTRDPLSGVPDGGTPLVTCAYGDMQAAYRLRPQRTFILLEHGVGLTFNHPAYAGGLGLRRRVALFLVPNEHTRRANAKVLPLAPQVVIGTPKLDEWGPVASRRGVGDARTKLARPTVCISFHWNGAHVAPEAGTAFGHYVNVLPELAKQESFTLIGHGHPKFPELRGFFEALGVEFVEDFREVMERADVYVNDCSSTMYEFLVTGKPVVILNAPAFRRTVNLGIRFWEYSDVGPQVNQPSELLPAILMTLQDPAEHAGQRRKAVEDLYPHVGSASTRAAEAIQDFLQHRWPRMRRIEQVDGESIGILYMGFGARAKAEILKSVASLKRIGLEIPVAVVGDQQVPGTQRIPWNGESPYDASQRTNFQFRAGRIKPHLCEITPFQRTLYIDADTEFMSDITAGFEFLSEVDLAPTEELLSIGQLYNKPRAGWEINIVERDATIQELGGNPRQKFLNSGVLFFRKNAATLAFFEEWGRQWLRWHQWDEQLALMRAIHASEIRYRALSVDWNHPHRNQAKIIFHNYGRGGARSNVR
jgi:hypothetical protein